MARVVMADDGIAFDGAMAETAPLGGAETAFVALAEALAVRGHQVEARNRCSTAVVYKGVRRASPVLAAQSCRLPEETAQPVAARPGPSHPGGDRSLPRGDDPAMAALRQARDHPLWGT